MNILNTSKPFRKFLEFDKYIDDDNDEIVHINKKSLRNNHKNGDRELNINGDQSDDSL